MYYELLKDNLNFKNNKLKPLYIYISPSNYCNSNCVFCNVHENHIKNSIIREPYKLFDMLKHLGTQYVHFMGGGEPLVDSQIWDYCYYLTNIGIKTAFTTNGFLLLEKGIDNILNNNIEMIFFSLDSHLPQQHDYYRRIPGLWKRAIDNICLIKKNKPQITVIINYLVHCNNVDGIMDFMILRDTIPYDFINFIIIKDFKELALHPAQLERLIEEKDDILTMAKQKGIGILGECFFSGKINNMSCLFPYYSAYIDFPTGNVYPCDCTIHRDERYYNCGNLCEKTFDMIWNGNVMSKLRQSLLDDMLPCKQQCDLVNQMTNRSLLKIFDGEKG